MIDEKTLDALHPVAKKHGISPSLCLQIYQDVAQQLFRFTPGVGGGTCEHPSMESQVKIARLTDVDDGPVTGYSADVAIHCANCMHPFVFIGLPGGMNPSFPTVSADGLEARMPIKPL